MTDEQPSRNRRRILASLAVIAVVLAAVTAVLLLRDDDPDTDVVAGPDESSTTTSTEDATTTTLASGPSFDVRAAGEAAALAFARDHLAMPGPAVGGEVLVRRETEPMQVAVPVVPRAGSPFVTEVEVACPSTATTCEVVGATTPNIVVEGQDRSTSPPSVTVAVHGQSTAFEATVELAVRRWSDGSTIAESFVMGGANGTMGPFDGSVTFPDPGTRDLYVVLFTTSAEDGHVQEATVVGVD